VLARGRIRKPELARVIHDFSGIRLKNITPTDIDGFIEHNNELMIFFEIKYKNSPLPFGQRLALERLVDVSHQNRPSILFVAQYDELNENNEVDGAQCTVRSYRYNKKWQTPKRSYSLGAAVRKFINYKSSISA